MTGAPLRTTSSLGAAPAPASLREDVRGASRLRLPQNGNGRSRPAKGECASEGIERSTRKARSLSHQRRRSSGHASAATGTKEQEAQCGQPHLDGQSKPAGGRMVHATDPPQPRGVEQTPEKRQHYRLHPRPRRHTKRAFEQPQQRQVPTTSDAKVVPSRGPARPSRRVRIRLAPRLITEAITETRTTRWICPVRRSTRTRA